MRYPEKIEVKSSVTSEARILGLKMPRTFLVGMPFGIEGEFRNTGTTPMPSPPPEGWEWELATHVVWSDGGTTILPTRFPKQLESGKTVRFGPFRTSVVAPGLFHAELRYPYEEAHRSPDGHSGSSMSGTESYQLMEAVAVDMNTIRTRWLLWISLATLVAVLVGWVIA